MLGPRFRSCMDVSDRSMTFFERFETFMQTVKNVRRLGTFDAYERFSGNTVTFWNESKTVENSFRTFKSGRSNEFGKLSRYGHGTFTFTLQKQKKHCKPYSYWEFFSLPLYNPKNLAYKNILNFNFKPLY